MKKQYHIVIGIIIAGIATVKYNPCLNSPVPNNNIQKIQPQISADNQTVIDKLWITPVKVHTIITPKSISELQDIVRTSHAPLAIAGGRYSQGGQTAYTGGTVINMKELNKIINLDVTHKTISVQAGATWYSLQNYIDSYNLSIASMPSYNNFTIGGSLSVNAHSRDLMYDTIISSVQSIEMILADGSLVFADRNTNSDLFYGAIGGYGLLGIITQVTLQLTDNIPLERTTTLCTINDFTKLFSNTITSNPNIIFYNTNIFPDKYEQCLMVTWSSTNKPLTTTTRLQKQKSSFYITDKTLEFFIRRVPFAKQIRPILAHLKKIPPAIVLRNYEMSYSVHQLAIKGHFPTTMTLQEYFIPVTHAQDFIKDLRSILQQNNANILNISIRHVAQENSCIMSYAPQESFSFVLYINTLNTINGIEKTCIWTRKLIDAALKYKGSYYLPYILCATKEQFEQAYPRFNDLLKIKNTYDPQHKFRNMLFKTYYENTPIKEKFFSTQYSWIMRKAIKYLKKLGSFFNINP